MQQTHRHIPPLKHRKECRHSLGNPNGNLLIAKTTLQNTENSSVRKGREHMRLHSSSPTQIALYILLGEFRSKLFHQL